MVFMKKSLIVILVPILVLWLLAFFFDIVTGSRWAIFPTFKLAFKKGQTRAEKYLAAVAHILRHGYVGLPLAILFYLVSPFLLFFFLIWDLGLVAKSLYIAASLEGSAATARLRVSRSGERQTTRRGNKYTTPWDGVGPKPKAEIVFEEDSDGDDVVTETVRVTGKFPVEWSAQQVLAFRKLYGPDKAYVDIAATELDAHGFPKAVHFYDAEGKPLRPAELME